MEKFSEREEPSFNHPVIFEDFNATVVFVAFRQLTDAELKREALCFQRSKNYGKLKQNGCYRFPCAVNMADRVGR